MGKGYCFARASLTRNCVSTGTEIASVQAATAEDVDVAVKAAHAALKSGPWKTMSGADRGVLMSRLADKIEASASLFATIDAWDNGKPPAIFGST